MRVLVGFFADGSVLMSDYLNVCGAARDGFCEDSVAFFRTDQEGNTLARFGSFVYGRTESRSGRPNVTFGEPHPQALWTVHGSRFYYADAKRFEIRVFDLDGALNGSCGCPTSRRATTATWSSLRSAVAGRCKRSEADRSQASVRRAL